MHFNSYSVIILIFRISIKLWILACYSIDFCYLSTFLKVYYPHSKCQIRQILNSCKVLKTLTQGHWILFFMNLWYSQLLYCLYRFFKGTFEYIDVNLGFIMITQCTWFELAFIELLGNRILHFWLGKHILQDPYSWYFIWVICEILETINNIKKMDKTSFKETIYLVSLNQKPNLQF